MSNKAETRPAVERLLTIAEAAELTSYEDKVILDWIGRGLPFVAGGVGRRRPRRKDIRIRASALWEWVRALEVVRTEGLSAGASPKRAKPRASVAVAGGLSAWRTAKKETGAGK